MQSDAKSITIDGKEYTVRMMQPRRALKLFRRIAECAAPMLSGAGDPQRLGSAASDFFSKMSDDLLDEVMKAFSEVSEVDGKPLDRVLDAHFCGDLGAMMKWAAFAFEVQFSPLLSSIKDILAAHAE